MQASGMGKLPEAKSPRELAGSQPWQPDSVQSLCSFMCSSSWATQRPGHPVNNWLALGKQLHLSESWFSHLEKMGPRVTRMLCSSLPYDLLGCLPARWVEPAPFTTEDVNAEVQRGSGVDFSVELG